MNILETRKLAEEMATLAAKNGECEDDEEDRYVMLVDLSERIDFSHVRALVSESDFKEYAQEMAEDVSGQDMSSWPFDHIDWSAAAHALKIDYKSVDFDGETYWYKS
jgi:hypothetical protein